MLLADNDALAKAAHWDLLECVPLLVDGTWQDVAILDTLLHRTRRAASGKKDRLFASAEIAAELLVNLEIAKIVCLPPPEIRAHLVDQEGIDPGEQILIGALLAQPTAMLLTGDKRALTAIPTCLRGDLIESIAGRCICTEQMVSFAITRFGLAELQKRVRPFVDRDSAAHIILGRSCSADAQHVQAALNSYIGDLRTRVHPLLAD